MDNQILASTPGATRTRRRALLNGIELLRCAAVASPQLDAQVLLCHALSLPKADLLLQLDEALTLEQERRLQILLERRLRREPVAYITGLKEFWSLAFVVNPNVLIPRPETELVVELSLEYAKTKAVPSQLKILDLGTGSGAIAISLAKELPEARIWAVDISPDALRMAQINAARHQVAAQITFLLGDLFVPTADSGMQFDLIVANPPYIKSELIGELAPEIRDYEPVLALDGGIDGLDYYRQIINQASWYLLDGGAILLEIGADQGDAVRHIFAPTAGFAPAEIYQDLAGQNRVIAASRGNTRG